MKDEIKGNGITGLIPDFFHDVIAYLIPGFTVGCLLFFNAYIATKVVPFNVSDFGIATFFFISVLAYVVGRILEHVGYITIHNKKLPLFGKKSSVPGPKWSLVFDEDEKSYTTAFKNNLEKKIEEWLEGQDGKAVMEECKTTKKDDYFNLIQFYLRERFPLVALYEKKQNATIVLTRSLCIGFFSNTFFYFITLFLMVPYEQIKYSHSVVFWILFNLLFSIVFYSRFVLDKKYHAMYIYETFIGMKKFLKSRKENQEAKDTVGGDG